MSYVGGDTPSKEDECFLCAVLGGGDDITALVVERAPRTITMLNRFPYSSGHLMVVPQRHARDPRELDLEDGGALFAASQRALSALEDAMHPDGFNVGLNVGTAAGGSVDHLHLHVVPRWAGDTNFMPVLDDVKVIPEHLAATAARLREAFGKRRT
jgi:ATP adenylyltransferase